MDGLGYFGPDKSKLRLKPGDIRILNLPATEPVVLRGHLSVEEARLRIEQGMPSAQRYSTVADYDPVLRSHCRLDQKDRSK